MMFQPMNNFRFNDILLDVREERRRQQELWGEQNHRPSKWLAILGEEYGEVCRAVCGMEIVPAAEREEISWKNYREELIHVAAVAIQMVECYDRSMNKVVAELAEEDPRQLPLPLP
jgi:NTP pyrophosphatase (non-canonical NTP hydrolase)